MLGLLFSLSIVPALFTGSGCPMAGAKFTCGNITCLFLPIFYTSYLVLLSTILAVCVLLSLLVPSPDGSQLCGIMGSEQGLLMT